MDFGEILSRAWNIIWEHKVLWIFGVLVSCGRSNGGCSGGGGSNTGYQYSGGDIDIPPEVRNFI